MGMILAPLGFFHFIIYCLGGIWYLAKVKGFKNKLKFFPITFFSCIMFSSFYLWLLFYSSKDQRIYSFGMYFNILLSLPTIIIILTSLAGFIRGRKNRGRLYHSFFPAFLMTPFTALILLFLFDNELSAYFNVTYFY